MEKPTKLQDADLLKLEVAKSNHKLASAQVEKAIAQNQAAELAYRFLVIQIYMKYGLSEKDAFNESGEIIYNQNTEESSS